MSELIDESRQKVLLLQGGGALGSCQAGVYEKPYQRTRMGQIE